MLVLAVFAAVTWYRRRYLRRSTIDEISKKRNDGWEKPSASVEATDLNILLFDLLFLTLSSLRCLIVRLLIPKLIYLGYSCCESNEDVVTSSVFKEKKRKVFTLNFLLLLLGTSSE